MNIASAVPPLEADFFDEKGTLKQYIPQKPAAVPAYRQHVCTKEIPRESK